MKRLLAIMAAIALISSGCEKETTISVKNKTGGLISATIIIGYNESVYETKPPKLYNLKIGDIKDGKKSKKHDIDDYCDRVIVGFKTLGNQSLYTSDYIFIEKGEDNVIELTPATDLSNYIKL